MEGLFKNYGRIREVTLKNGFGFVEFNEAKDAEDAVYDFDGKDFFGERHVQSMDWDGWALVPESNCHSHACCHVGLTFNVIECMV